MICRKCSADVPDAPFCCQCGAEQTPKRTQKKRGNGQGSVYRLPNGTYRATVTLGIWLDDQGKLHRRTKSQNFKLKKDAVAAVSTLRSATKTGQRTMMTFKQLYDRWLPTHKVGKSTIDCYKAAVKYFSELYCDTFSDIDIDDLQECLDDCPKGKRTKENMRALVSLLYKYAIPRHQTANALNLSQYLTIERGGGAAHRSSFTSEQVALIRDAVGVVPGADAVYAMIYLGFRPSEFLALTQSSYDAQLRCIVGGAKTEAGKGRTVTISPKILDIVQSWATPGNADAPLYPDPNGNAWDLKTFTEKLFYPALDAIGIDNPMVEIGGGVLRHKYAPHSCRHTFATLLKRVTGPEKDKLEIMGHTSGDMLRYYQDIDLNDLRVITDAL